MRKAIKSPKINLDKIISNVGVVLAGWAAMVISAFIGISFIHWMIPPDPWGKFLSTQHLTFMGLLDGGNVNFLMIFTICILAPLWEEIVFRNLPIQIIKHFKLDALKWPIILFVSCIFGLGHGSIYNLLIQGVGGVILSQIYIKNGYSYWSSVAAHSLYNLSLVLGFAVLS